MAVAASTAPMQQLRVLTFNISGHNCSTLAPPGFSLKDKYLAISRLVLAEKPHLLTLQEVDTGMAWTEDLGAQLLQAGYEPCGSTESHCGWTVLWAQASLRAQEVRSVGPVALARIPLPLPAGDGSGGAPEAAPAAAGAAAEPEITRCIFFAGCHLEPFAEGARLRLKQVEQTLRALPPRSRLVLAGDCNMRNAENDSVEALGLADAFVQLGKPRDANFSWNTRINRYHGEDAFAYTARYDRVYLRGLRATELRLMANAPLTPGQGDFLSDHFGLAAILELLPQPPPSPPEALRPSAKRKGPPPGGRAAAAEAGGRAVSPRQLF